MLMSGGYNDDGYHFDEYEAKEVVEQMYHVKDNKKYIGEKYDMNKAHWFGGNIDNKVFESAITFWFKDVDFDGDKVWEYFHMNN